MTMSDAGVQIVFEVPPGALRQTTEITITPVSFVQNLPLIGGPAAAVQFEPFGLLFFTPAELLFNFGENAPVDLLGFGWRDGQKDFHLRSTVEAPGQVSLPIFHFSGAGVGIGNASAAGQVGAAAQGLFARYMNERELSSKQLYSSMCPAADSCPAGSQADAAFRVADTAARDQQIEDYLLQLRSLADTNPLSRDGVMEAATQYFNFKALAQATCNPNDSACIFNQDSIKSLLNATGDLVTDAFVSLIEALGDPVCNDIALYNLIADIDSVDFIEAVVAAAGDVDLPSLQRRVGCALSITINNFPAQITEDDDGSEFTVTLALIGVDDFASLPLTIELQVSQCGRIEQVNEVTGELEPTDSTSVNGDGVTPMLTLYADNCPDNIQSISVTAKVEDFVNAFFGDQTTASAALIISDPVLLPAEKRVEIGDTLQLQLVTPGESPALEWSATGGTVSESGLYTAGMVPGTYEVTVRIPDRNFVLYSTIEVFGTAISVSPNPITVEPGGTVAFSAAVVGPEDNSVTWSASGGTITANGEYTAGDNPGEYFVTATSVADPSVSAVAQITIPGGPSPIYGTWLGDFTFVAPSTGNVFTCENGNRPDRCVRVSISTCEVASFCIYGNLRACLLPESGLCSAYYIYDGEVSGDSWTGVYKGYLSSSRSFRPASSSQSACSAQFIYSAPASGGGTVSGTADGSLTQPCSSGTTEYYLDVQD